MQNNNILIQPAVDERKVVELRHPVPEKTRKQIEDTYNVQITFDARRSGTHNHPWLAVELSLCTSALADKLRNLKVRDCYGNHSQMRKHGFRNFWSNSPPITASDILRISNSGPNSCTCDPNQCTHFQDPDVSIYLNSAYYATITDLVTQLLQTKNKYIYIVGHQFPELAGNYHGNEMRYYHDGPNTVRASMDYNGNHPLSVYHHSDMMYLNEKQMIYFDNGTMELVHSRVMSVGDTHVYMTTLQHTLGDPYLSQMVDTFSPWNAATWNDPEVQYLGLPTYSSGSKKLAYQLSLYSINLSAMRRVNGLIFCLSDESHDVVLSEAIIANARSFCLGKQRDYSLYQKLLGRVKNDYLAVPNLPPNMIDRAVLATVTLAYTSVSEELQSLFTIIDNFGGIINDYNNTLAFNPPGHYRLSTILYTSLGVTSTIFVWVCDPLITFTTSNSISNITALSLTKVSTIAMLTAPAIATLPHLHVAITPNIINISIYSISAALVMYSFWRRAWSHEIKYAVKPYHVPAGRITIPLDLIKENPYTPIFLTGKQKEKQPDHADLIISPNSQDPEEFKSRYQLTGIGFQYVPTWHVSSLNNLVSGLMKRLLRDDLPKAKPGIWINIVSKWNTTPYVKLVKKEFELYVSEKSFIDWSTARYSQRRCKELRQVFNTLKSQSFKLQVRDWDVGVFVKTEKTHPFIMFEGDIVDYDCDDKAARIITTMSDPMLVLTAPVLNRIKERQTQVFNDILANLTDYPIPPVGPSNCSAETISSWVDIVVDQLGPDHYYMITGDGSSFDAHTGDQQMEAQRIALYGGIHIKNKNLEFVLRNPKMAPGKKTTKIVARDKLVAFTEVDRRLTGQTETSLGNTQITLMSLCYLLEEIGHEFTNLGDKYFIAGNGDDMLAFVNITYLHNLYNTTNLGEIKIAMSERMLDLGYTHTMLICKDFSDDFCSKLFYPINQGKNRLIGGKIGRALVRAGYLDITNLDMYGYAVSSLHDNYHVPFLKEYFERLVQLASKDQKKIKPDVVQDWMMHCEDHHFYDLSTLDFVESKYGLTVKDLEDFKTLLRDATSIPITIYWPKLGEILAIDCA